jgi:3-oxoacyl-[acyl-carrier-protein] synthase II
MDNRRVAITGLGAVTSAGIGMEPLWDALLAGESAVREITLFDASEYPSSVAGEVQGFSARKFVPKDYRKAVKVMARDIELAVGAAQLAFDDSGLTTRAMDGEMDIEPATLGCNIGAGLISCELDELAAAAECSMIDGQFDIKTWGREGINQLTPLWLLKYLPNMLSCHATIIHGAEGPSNCITCGDASGHMSVGETMYYIAEGVCDAAITGSAESKLNPLCLLRQALLKRLNTGESSPASCKPFDAAAAGTVMGEGGGLVILEELNRAKARNARVYAEVVGFGSACDPAAIDVTQPTVGHLHLAVRNALQSANLSADDIDLIVTHGTGVAAEDALEANAWKMALGDRISEVPACAITGAIGSLFAGAGGVEVAVAAKALAEQTVPATCNLSTPAEGCGLNLSAQSRSGDFTYAITAAFTVGGQSAAVILKRAE